MSAPGDGPAAKPQRGAFIVLEGLDRSGKTTQVKLLEQKFIDQGRPVKLMRFPGELALERRRGMGLHDDDVTRKGLLCWTVD